jgi:hypothetical protein
MNSSALRYIDFIFIFLFTFFSFLILKFVCPIMQVFILFSVIVSLLFEFLALALLKGMHCSKLCFSNLSVSQNSFVALYLLVHIFVFMLLCGLSFPPPHC